MSFILILYYYCITKLHGNIKNTEMLLDIQSRRWKNLQNKVLSKSEFYRTFSGKDLSGYPIMDKQGILENFDKINTAGINLYKATELAIAAENSRNFTPKLNGITVGLSSGTSGTRGVFLANNYECSRWAGSILAKVLPTNILRPQKIALFMRANSNLYTSINKSQRINFNFFDLEQEFISHIAALNSYNPDILVAPPKALELLAKYKHDNELTINPTKIISIADVLDNSTRNKISEAFKQIIHEIYQCTEGLLGSTCKYGVLHLHEESLIIEKEWLDSDKKRFIPIITDLLRTTQPTIRYKLNDILVMKDSACQCGSACIAINNIEGRTDEILWLKDNQTEKLKMVFPDFIRRIFMNCADIQDYRVIQLDCNLLQIEIIAYGNQELKNVEEQAKLAIERFCGQFNYRMPDIMFTPYQHNNLANKRRRVICKFNHTEVYNG